MGPTRSGERGEGTRKRLLFSLSPPPSPQSGRHDALTSLARRRPARSGERGAGGVRSVVARAPPTWPSAGVSVGCAQCDASPSGEPGSRWSCRRSRSRLPRPRPRPGRGLTGCAWTSPTGTTPPASRSCSSRRSRRRRGRRTSAGPAASRSPPGSSSCPSRSAGTWFASRAP